MTISSAASGTQTAVINTEHTLTTQTAAGTYVGMVDTTNMVTGDVVEIRAKVKVLSGGAAVEYFCATYAGAQSEIAKFSIPVPTLYSVAFTLKQTAGTGRNFDWNVALL